MGGEDSGRRECCAGRATGNAPPARAAVAGAGAVDLPVPYEGCAPIGSRFVAAGDFGFPPIAPSVVESWKVVDDAAGLTGGVCGHPADLFLDVVVNTTRARSGFATAARAWAQVWSDGAPAGERAVEAPYVAHRGRGDFRVGQYCFGTVCYTYALFRGDGATVELLGDRPLTTQLPDSFP